MLLQEQCRRVYLGNHFDEDVEDLECDLGCDLCQRRNLGGGQAPSFNRFAKRFAELTRLGDA